MPKGQNSKHILEIEELELLLVRSFQHHHLRFQTEVEGLEEEWVEHLDNLLF